MHCPFPAVLDLMPRKNSVHTVSQFISMEETPFYECERELARLLSVPLVWLQRLGEVLLML
jgi:hypothetical protein